jgi:APA family basic amino acid/polyamine antiporter
MYAFGAMLSFTIAHLAVIRLRASQPEAERPHRGPGNIRIRGVDLPLFAVVGGLATFVALCVLTALHVVVAIAGIGWLVFGILVYIWYRHRQGLDLTSTVQVAIPKPAVEHEAEYESVLVALEGEDVDAAGAIALAVRLAARRRRGIFVLVTLPVPYAVSLDDAMPEREAAAQSLIDQAKIQGGRRVTGEVRKVRPGQAGREIVAEARELRARAIVMPLSRGAGRPSFNKTVQTVLSERPCRVIIQTGNGSEPAKTPAAATAS